MAWTVAQTCSSIVTKLESTRHRQRTKQALGRNSHCVNTVDECTVQKSHCVNIVEETHWVEITLCQHRQGRRHWAETTLCQHHRRHSRRGITKNVHSLCNSLDCRRQDQRISSFIDIVHEVSRMRVSSGKVAFSAAASLFENFPLEFGAAFTSMSSNVFSLAPNS